MTLTAALLAGFGIVVFGVLSFVAFQLVKFYEDFALMNEGVITWVIAWLLAAGSVGCGLYILQALS